MHAVEPPARKRSEAGAGHCMDVPEVAPEDVSLVRDGRHRRPRTV